MIRNFRLPSFHPTLVPTVAAAVVLALTLYLATWQQGRASEKRVLQASFDARSGLPPLGLPAAEVSADAVYRRAVAVGEFDRRGQIFLDNKSNGSVVGYHVVTPLQLEGTQRVVLVNRGFVPRGSAYPRPPLVQVPDGRIEVRGLLSAPTAKFLELGSAPTVQGEVWQNLTIERYRKYSGRDVVGLVLLANPTADGLIPIIERPDAKVDKHVEYMLTFYSLAVTIVVLWVALNLKFRKPDGSV